MGYKTIKMKVAEQMMRRISGKCPCGKELNRKNIHHYINEFGECVPICGDCMDIIWEYIEVIP